MKRLGTRWMKFGLILSGTLLLLLAMMSASISSAQPAPTATRSLLSPPATRTNLTIVPPPFAYRVPLPKTDNFDIAQLDIGRRTFTQYCVTCHGDKGQGLEQWRTTWAPERQNCTQVGCHGRNRPPDGFTMLTVAPPILGEGALPNLTSAFAIFTYLKASMPYQAPGALSDREYWAITAYMVDQFGADAKGKEVGPKNAADILIR